MPKFSRPNAYNGRQSNQYLTGSVRAANATEAAAGESTELYISPSTLSSAVGSLVPAATTSTAGVVTLTDNSDPVATKVYVDAIAIAGAPVATESVQGIGELATDAQAIARTASTGALALLLTPSNLSPVLASPSAIGSTAPAAGTFTALTMTTSIDLQVGGTWDSGGTAIDIATDSDTAALNLGTVGARSITLGNSTSSTAVAITSGTGHITLTSTGTGDIIINSDDTLLLDSDGVLELNSSAGVISIGNDDIDQNINLGTDGERTITIGSSNGACSLVLDCGTGALNIGVNTIAHTITIGNMTAATAVAVEVGTGNFTVNGVGASTYTIGAATTSGTITIGGTAQTGTLGLGVSSGVMTTNLSTGNGAKTLNIATGVSGNTVNLGTGINTSAQVINIASGASAANSTVNILSGNGTAGTQTLNVLTGSRAGALNLGTGGAAHVISIGGSFAGAITVDTASGVSIDSATASNFTVTGAADLTLDSSAGSVNIDGGQAAVDAVSIQASNAAGGIDMDSGTGGIAIDSTGAVSIDAAAACNFTVTGAGIDLTLDSAAGRVILNGEEAAANAVTLLSAAGGIDADAALQINLTSSQNAGDAIRLNASAGGIDIDAAGAAGEDITIDNAAGSVNITAGESAGDAIVLTTSDASGGLDIAVGTGGVAISGTGSFLSLATTGAGLRQKAGAATDFCGNTTLSNGTVTISNTNIATGDLIFLQRIDDNSSTTMGQLSYTISNGASFTINSLILGTPGSIQTGDDSTVAYFIVRPL